MTSNSEQTERIMQDKYRERRSLSFTIELGREGRRAGGYVRRSDNATTEAYIVQPVSGAIHWLSRQLVQMVPTMGLWEACLATCV